MKASAFESGDKGLYAYHVLRIAVEVFGQQPVDLNPEQLKAARAQADKTRALEDLALSSPEGARISVPDAAVGAGVAQIKARYEDEAAFHAAMHSSDLTERDLRRALWRELAFDAVMTLAGEGVDAVSDADVADFYARYPERFVRPELRTARHILITINPDYSENTPEAAHARINDLYEEAQAAPEKFAALATKHSECPTALDGGLLGQVPPGKLYQSLDAVLFQLDPGGVGGPVETEAGLHIITCDDIKPGATITLDQARDKIREYLMAERLKARQKAWLQTLV